MLPGDTDDTDGATVVVKDPDLTPISKSSSKEACTWYWVSAVRPLSENVTGDADAVSEVSDQLPEVPAR